MMTLTEAKAIAYMLNEIGVVTHDDVGVGKDDEFGGWVCRHEAFLREHGYVGGELRQWNTGFRTAYWVYGAIDDSCNLSDELLDTYFTATYAPVGEENLLEISEMLLKDLPKFKLSLVFNCPCGAETVVEPKCYSLAGKANPAYLAGALCDSCKKPVRRPAGVRTKLRMPPW